MPERAIDLGEVAKLARTVTLDSVCWREVTARRLVEQSQLPESLVMCGSHDATGMRDAVARQIVVVAEFNFFAMNAQSERVAEVTGRLALRYSVGELEIESISAELVDDFAKSNGLYNGWPYWRELVQSTASRVGIHGVVAPVFRIGSQPSAQRAGHRHEDEQAAAEEPR